MKTVAIIVGINTDAIDVDDFPKWLGCSQEQDANDCSKALLDADFTRYTNLIGCNYF